MNILCIDASTSNFGLAWFKDKKLIKVRNEYFSGKFSFEKMKALHLTFNNYFTLDVDLVIFEQPVPVRFSNALTSINQSIGLLIGLCYTHNIEVCWIHNRTIKKRMGVTEHGKEGKKQGIEIVKKMYPKFADQITTDHIADAIMVGETYFILECEDR